MITVAGFNTAMDRRVDLDVLRPGTVQRAGAAHVQPGGKGLHVAQMVVALGEPACLVGLDDAIHAARLADHLQVRGVEWHAVRTPHSLRQCLALHEAGGRVTEILEPGMALDGTVRKALLDTLLCLLDDSRVLVLSGSLPRGFPVDTYAILVREAARRGLPCLVDASGDTLRHAVQAGPWLVKPNADEATALMGKPLDDLHAVADCVRHLNARGVARPVVTLGARGAVGFDGQMLWRAWPESGEVRNSVGSGDCFVAAMAVSAARGEPMEMSLKRAVACGAANAESAETGFAETARVRAWMSRVHVEPLSASIGSASETASASHEENRS